jgi:hypothetical protein
LKDNSVSLAMLFQPSGSQFSRQAAKAGAEQTGNEIKHQRSSVGANASD